MKTFRLLIVALLLATSVSAQHRMRSARHGEYAPTVYMISMHQLDTIYTDACTAQQVAALNRLSAEAATQDYLETHRTGYQQTEAPQFVFASKNNKFSFALGGFVALRTAYEFEGTVDNLDFVPYDIPIPGNYATDQKLTMDASTSRLFLKAIANTRALGRIIIYVDGDFRGGAQGSYIPRLRSAYVSLKGFTFGRDITTFCDVQAGPTTVDFQGPNAYNYQFATMLRYECSFARDHMQFGLAAEMPDVSATYNENFAPLPQRMPDFPVYLQVQWGQEQRQSHLRASAVFRNLYARNLATGRNTSLFGWGAQFSGNLKLSRWFQLFMNGVYGEGITPYIQDLKGSGLDFTPNPANPARIQTMPMWGWQAAAQLNLSRRVALSGGYSMVRIEHENGYYADNEYRQGQYIFGNIFYSLTPRFKMAAEYLYGTRKNMDGLRNHANRAQVLMQYSF